MFVSDFVRTPRALPDGRNDLVVDFGSPRGLWQHIDNTRQWVRIETASPSVVAAGDLDGDIKDEVIAGFAGRGLFARDDRIASGRSCAILSRFDLSRPTSTAMASMILPLISVSEGV